MTQPSPDELLLIGFVSAPFGVRGQIKLKSVTDRPDHLKRHIRTIYLGKSLTPYQLKNLFEHKPGLLIISLQGVDTPEAVSDLRGSEVYILERESAPLSEDEYFIHQLYGLEVLTEAGEVIGKVREVIITAAQEVLIVARPGQADALIPMVREIVISLDILAGKAVIRPIEGLL